MLMPLLFVVMLWFFSTGAILWLNRLPRETHPASITGMAILCGPAVCGVLATAPLSSTAATYVGFASSLIIWGWHEASFLMGFVAGPRRLPCPTGAKGWERFRLATATVIHHEIALAGTALALYAITWGQPNLIAANTFALLFVLRLASKLNIFLGVANINLDMMPAHLDYLKSYFRKSPINALFPFSFAATIALTIWLYQADQPLLFILGAIGLIENTMLMLPLPSSRVWDMFRPQKTKDSTPASQSAAHVING